MAPAEGAQNGCVNGYAVGTNDQSRVRELLENFFPRLSESAEELLFTPDAHKFGVFDYTNVVNTICKTELDDTSNHSSAVIWLAAGFLLTHKLIRTGSALDAHLSTSAPTMIDAALLFQFCSKDHPGPRRATRALSVSDVEDVYVADMEFLKPVKMYSTFTNAICRFAKEALATPYAPVAILAMLGLTCIAASCFVKLQASLEPFLDPKVPSPGLLFPKEDILDDLMQSMTGPLFGHHPLIAVDAPACGNLKNPKTGEVDWPETLKKYEEGLVWLLDWDVEGREDRDAGRIAEMVVPDYGPNHVDTNPTITDDVIIAREKNRVGCQWNTWDTETDNALMTGKVRKLARHSGFFCHQLPDTVREIFVVVTSYFSFGFWPSGDWHDVASIWHEMTGYIGSMVRGNMIDHDTEADIGEHNGQNWLCKTCADGVLEWATRVETHPPKRTVVDQRLAWGPQTYFFYSRRHCGLARRVYSRKFLSRPGIQWGVVATIQPHTDSVTAPLHFETLETLILYTLNLAGFTVDPTDLARLCAAMPPVVDPAKLGLCSENCAVGLDLRSLGLEMMLYGHGTMVLAAMLPEPARRRFCWEIDGYSTRAFPTLYSRMLSTCGCSAYWIEAVLQLGYGWALGTCGCDNCDRDEDVGCLRVVPGPVEESGRVWFADPRVRANLERLKGACKARFESMPIIRRQIESGRLQEEWSVLPCADQVRAKMAKEGIKDWNAVSS